MTLTAYCQDWLKHTVPEDWKNVTVAEVKHEMVEMDGEVIFPATQVIKEIKRLIKLTK